MPVIWSLVALSMQDSMFYGVRNCPAVLGYSSVFPFFSLGISVWEVSVNQSSGSRILSQTVSCLHFCRHVSDFWDLLSFFDFLPLLSLPICLWWRPLSPSEPLAHESSF